MPQSAQSANNHMCASEKQQHNSTAPTHASSDAETMHSHLEFLVQDSAKEVQHDEVGVSALPSIPAISQQAGHQDKLLGPSLLGSIYQMKCPLQRKPSIQC